MASTSTILIADDEAIGRETLEALLEPQGYRLLFADSGEETLQKAATHLPDLVLLDVIMPDMDGIEVCRQLRTNPTLAEVPVIIVTSLNDRTSKIKALEAGADDFVSKPIDRLELRTRVRTTTQLNRYRHLVHERSKFECISEQANDGFVILDEDLNIHYANPKARLFLNLPPNEAAEIGRDFITTAGKNYRLEPVEAWKQWNEEKHFLMKNSLYLVNAETDENDNSWVQVDLMPYADGVADHQLIRLRDISDQVSTKLGIARFHNFISHKIRTPLNGLLGCMDVIAESQGEMPPEELVELADLGTRSAKRIEDDLEDILNFIRADEPSGCETSFPIQDLESWLHGLPLSSGTGALNLSISDELKCRKAAIQPHALELVFANILENAIKFHPKHEPSILIELDEADENRCRLKVTDNGRSLSPRELTKVWTPYYQGEKQFTGETSGMGLGLSIVATIVWNAKGRYRIYNRPDEQPGIVIDIELPLESTTTPQPV